MKEVFRNTTRGDRKRLREYIKADLVSRVVTWHDLKNILNRKLKCDALMAPSAFFWPEYIPTKWESWSGDVTVRLVEISTQNPESVLPECLQAPSRWGPCDTVP